MTYRVNDIFNEDNQPLVSILMNCYNGEKYLRQAIESVLVQTYQNWEVIFWDNQSTDTSAEIFKSYIDPRLKYYYAPKHTILYEARNYALENVVGEFIAFLDVDDWWLPEKLKSQVLLLEDLEVGFVCSNFFIEDQNNGKSSLAYKEIIPQGRVLDDLLCHYFVGLLTLVVRRSALLYSNMHFDSRYHIIGDFDLVIRLAVNWKLASTQEALAVYRIHGDNESSKHRELRMVELNNWYEENSKHTVISRSKSYYSSACKILYAEAVDNLMSGNKKNAVTYMGKIPWGLLKLRLIIVLLLPRPMLEFLKN